MVSTLRFVICWGIWATHQMGSILRAGAWSSSVIFAIVGTIALLCWR